MDTRGNRIRTLRESKGWTQERLAGVVGVKRASLGNYETGRTRPTTKLLKKIAIALGTQPMNLDPDLEPVFDSKTQDLTALRNIDRLILEKLQALSESNAGKVYSYVCALEEQARRPSSHAAASEPPPWPEIPVAGGSPAGGNPPRKA